MEDYRAFLFFIKTNFDKFIGYFVHSKFENTKEMKYKIGKKSWNGKKTNE